MGRPVSHGAGAASGSPAPARPLEEFRALVLERGGELYRDLPWRRTRDPYEIWISEVMLQQTQTTRVDGRWQRWLERFPTPVALAAAEPADVLEEWQGLGYNRRALALHRAAQAVAALGGELPAETAALEALPGVGPATAAGIRAFAFDLPSVYLETNVRTVLLHELFPGEERVSDRTLVPILRATCPPDAGDSRRRPAHLVLRPARLRRLPQAHRAQPVAPLRRPRAPVALRGVAPPEARRAAARPSRPPRRAARRWP